MLWALIVLLLVLWLLGLVGSVGGAFIHLLLVIAAIVSWRSCSRAAAPSR